MPNIKNNMYTLVKKTKKLSILLILVMLFSSVFNIVTIADEDPKPDLIIVEIVVHGDIVEEEDIIIEVTIKNQKDVDISGNIKVGLFLDYNWITPVSIASLPSGLSGDTTESVNLSWTAELGVYTLSVFVDYLNEIDEEDENNNVQDISLNVSERNTDLTFVEDEFTIDGVAHVGASVAISATATNIGKNTSEEITAALYINGSKNQEIKLEGLSKGETYPISFAWTPENFGKYGLSIRLDPEDEIEEQTNENNNLEDDVNVNIARLEWRNTSWHYRKFYDVTGTGNLSIDINFTELLNELNVFDKEFENDTIIIVKYTRAGDIVGVVSNYSFNESEGFDSVTNAVGNLTWVINESLYYCIYFDVTANEGVRVGRNESFDFNISEEPLIGFIGSTEGWWSEQNGSLLNYYVPDTDEMNIQIDTMAFADSVQAQFYWEGNFSHSVELESDNNLIWTGVSTFSDIGNWTVEIGASDTAGYQPRNLTYNFYIGYPDLTVVNITFTSSLPGSSPFYEGYNVNINANVTVHNITVYNVTVSLEINGTEVDRKFNLTIIKDVHSIVVFEHNFNKSGHYEVTVKIDPDDSIDEGSYELNNDFSKTLNISGIPDLGIINITVPKNYFEEGEKVTIYALVNNTGNDNASDYRVNLYFEEDNMSYTNVINHTFVSLKINETKNISLIWDYAEPGEWIVGIKILQNATKPDSNILNNSKARFDVRVKVNSTENNAPVIDILEPQSLEEFERNRPVEIIAKITDESGLEKVDITITDPDKTTYEEVMTKQENDKYSFTFGNTHLLEIYSFSITAIDNYNNKRTETSNFTIIEDATPPEIDSIRALPSLQLKNKEVTISCIVSDSSGVKSVQVTIIYPNDDEEVEEMTNSPDDDKYYYTQSYEMLGKYIFYITTEDILGNEKEYEDDKVEFWITTNLEDTDSDGMPDWWEEKYGFDPRNPADAAEDEDNDGYTNVEEYEDDMDPLEPLSLLQRIVKETKENWIYVVVSGILFIVVIALSIYGVRRRRKT